MHYPSYSKLKEVSMQNLAYIGDAVYELYVRQELLLKSELKASKLNHLVVKYVNAKFQAQALISLKDKLSAEEYDIARRGRNANPGTKAKHASIGEYRLATAFEALIGYLHLKQEFSRLEELLSYTLSLNMEEEDK